MRLFLFVLCLMIAPAAMAEEKAAEGHGSEAKTEHGEAGKEADKGAAKEEISDVKQARVFTPTETQLLLELDQQRVELERRAEALELREKLVDLMEQRLNGRVAELQQLKAELDKLLVSASGKDDKELQQLAAIYGAMKPTVAAGVLNRLDNPIVLDVLTKMPVKKSGKIMESIDPAKARILSEMMADKVPLPVVSTTIP